MVKKIIKRILAKGGIEVSRKSENDEALANKIQNRYIQNQKYLFKDEFKYILWLDRVYTKVEKVPGHIVELGVAYGRNAILFGHHITMSGDESVRKYIGFDTFNGYTEETLITNKNLSSDSWTDNSKRWVENKIKKVGLHNQCKLIEGDILHTIPNYTQENPNLRIALLYIDCNAFEPALFGMEHLKEFMSPGGIICIDEKLQGGETKALIEFCKRNNLVFMKDSGSYAMPAYTVV